MSTVLYSWKFNDKKERSQLWYIIAISIVIGLSIWGFFTKQYGMSFIVLFLAGLGFFVENNSDEVIEVKLSDLGMYIGETFYEYQSIKRYNITYSGDQADILRLQLSKRGIALLDIRINNDILPEIQNILNQFIEDGGKAELSSTDKIIRFLNL
ncbi:MAG: hypothetical protein GY828_04925 [Candidatus Gracilibacteria bacterium]|nr:hypothetical protein [Candidatus Gracilibacteria bacterium]